MAMHTAPQIQSSTPVSDARHLELETQVIAQMVHINSGWRKLLLQAEVVAPHLQLAAIEGENGSGNKRSHDSSIAGRPFRNRHFSATMRASGW